MAPEGSPRIEQAREQATYLWVAETVLRRHRRPLSARQIVSLGLESGLFADRDISRTPQKSMQARLSTDILERRDNSKFLRTEPGRFLLRELAGQGSRSDIKEYSARRRVPVPSSERVLVIPKRSYKEVLTFQGVATNHQDVLASLLSSDGLMYLPRTKAETSSEYKQFVTYTIIQQRDRILSFRRGQYNRAASFLRGARCIGFGGHVTEEDIDLFARDDRGIRANAAREISEEIRFENGRPTIDREDIEVLGVLNDDSSDVGVRHVGIVLRYWAPEDPNWATPLKGEASISQLAWMKTSETGADLLEFEYWSQLILRTYYPASLTSKPAFKIIRSQPFHGPHLLVVLGSVGSGKSIATRELCEKAGYSQINSGQIVAKLLGIPPVPQTPRDEFQRHAFELISSPDAPSLLASAIADEAEILGSRRIVIDGIRQLATLEKLKARADRPVGSIFVHTPPDVAYRFYMLREANSVSLSLSDFMQIYNAPVESEVNSMITEADAIIYNWWGLDEYELVISRLTQQLGLVS